MKVLVVAKKTSPKRLLVELHTDKLVSDIATLMAKRRYSQAIRQVLAKGRIEKEVAADEKVIADLIITEE